MPQTISGAVSAVLSWKNPWFLGVIVTREGKHLVERRIVGQLDVCPALRSEVELDGAYEVTKRFGRQFRFSLLRPTYTAGSPASMARFLALNCPGFHLQNALQLIHQHGVAKAFPALLAAPADDAVALHLTPDQLLGAQLFLRRHFHPEPPTGVELLGRLGFDRTLAQKALQIYTKGELKQVIRLAPYALIQVGATLAQLDTMAKHKGRELADNYLVLTAHCQRTGSTLLSASDLSFHSIDAAMLRRMLHWKLLTEFKGMFAPTAYLEQEKQIARWLVANAARSRPLDMHIPDGPANDEQRQAILGMQASSPFLLVGGPGMGKTHTLGTYISSLNGQSFVLLAPTGKAAKRMQEVSPSAEPLTIHRFIYRHQALLELPAEQRGAALPDIVIIDEASMVDVALFAQLLQLLPTSVHLILVGDADQLPSIAPGNLLRDTLAYFQSRTLLQNCRQCADSSISVNAARINSGNPLLVTDEDTKVHPTADTAALLNLLSYYLMIELPKHYDVMRDVQVISPTYSGPLGVEALNTRLRDSLNPVPRPGRFAVGDKVVMSENSYRLGVVNGDAGIVHAIHGQSLEVAFPTGNVQFSGGEARALEEAWALSTHKVQGSEFKVVILCLHPTMSQPLLSRALLYTAMTRAREKLIILGPWETIEACASNTVADLRTTALPLLLKAA